MAFSITTVTNNKTPEQMARINETKDGPMGWARTGTYLHSCMEQHLLGSLTIGDLEPWATEYVLPAVNNPIWDNFSLLAAEYRVCDLQRSIGGSFDALLQSKKTGRVLLVDFKSQRSLKAKPYDCSKQLGGYVHLLQQHHRLLIDGLAVGWIRPGAFQFEVLKTTPDQAVMSYQAARDLFLEANVPF